MIRKVGIIGLGKMGLPIARHLVSHGFDVSGFDVHAPQCEAAAKVGVTPRGNPREVAAASDLSLILVGFDDEVMEVVQAEDGLLAGAKSGSVIAVASTVSADTMQEVQKLATAKNVDVIDAPLCRGEPAAESGKLLVLVGGDEPIVTRCRPVLAAFGNDVIHVGGLGSGQIGKMINNLLLWACVSANWEGLKLAEALGVDSEKLRQALLLSSGNNWALETWLLPRPMPWAEKDMAIVMENADKARLSLPLCGVTREVVKGIKIERGLPPPPRR